MFIFIYNTLVLDVKRIDFEARMIDTLRSSSRVFFFFRFIYFLPTNLLGFSLFFSIKYAAPIYIRYAAIRRVIAARDVRSVVYWLTLRECFEYFHMSILN